MNKINEAINYIKVPHFFNDVIYFLMGSNFLFFLNYYYKPDIQNIPNLSYINDFIVFTVFVFTAYTTGRVLKIISDIWLSIIFLIFRNETFEKIKENYKIFIKIINNEQRIIKANLRDISHDAECLIQNEEYLRNEFERKIYSNSFMRSLLGMSIVVVIITRFLEIGLVIILILTLLILIKKINDSERKGRVGEYVLAKNRNLTKK